MRGVNAGLVGSVSRSGSLIQRVSSALVLLVLIIGIVYWGIWPVILMTAAVIVIALLEYSHALRQAGVSPRPFVGIASGLLLCGAAVVRPYVSFDITGVALTSAVMLALIAELPRQDRQGSLAGWALTFAGACYISWLLSHYILLRTLEMPPLRTGWLAPLQISPGAAWVYTVLAITWFQDAAALLVGRIWGQHRMAPYLSPKKSWEGAAGGFGASVLAALLAVPLLGLPVGYGGATLLGIVGGIAGPVGDLAESFIKRQIGVKDASNIIPGHGGVLDRADSMLFTAPVLYYLVVLLTAPLQ
jgi:phosphatidate cytidylyltransferase